MFYSHEVLTSRKYGVATVWLVATLGSKSTLKKVSRKAILDVDVAKACQTITEPTAPMALRLQSNLLYGIARVYTQQCGYVLNDAEAARNNMRAMFKVMRTAALEPDDRHKGRADQLVLQDDPNFLPDFDLLPIDLDQLDLDAGSSGALAAESQSSLLSPRNQRMTVNDINIPAASATSFIGGLAGGVGSSGIRGDSGPGRPGGRGLFLEDDIGMEIGADGKISFDDAPSTAKQAPAPMGAIGGMQPVSTSSNGQGFLGGQAGDTTVDQQYNDDYMPQMDDYRPATGAEPLPSHHAGVSNQSQVEIVSEESASSAPMRRRRQAAPKVIAPDTTLELRNGELARWNTDYVANMQEANKHKQAARAVALARENAKHWVLGDGTLTALGHSDVLVKGPLEMFSGAKLLQALTGVRLAPGGDKRARDGDDAESQITQRKRFRGLNAPSDEIALGIGGDAAGGFSDEGFMLAMGDHYIPPDVEQGREAATPLEDQPISAVFPWNPSTGSRRPTGGFNSASVLGGAGQQGGMLSRRGSRLVTASPLLGRGLPGATTTIDDLGRGLQSDGIDGHDLTNFDDFELLGAAAQVDTQIAGQSQWQRTALDSEPGNFFEFVKTGIEELDLARDEAAMGDEDDEALKGSIDFGHLLRLELNSRTVAAQGLLHVLTLGTKNLLHVQQDEAFGPISMRLVGSTNVEKEAVSKP